MLILSRKAGETILLAGTIAVSVLAIEGRRVTIGIRAPLEIPIVREELLHRGASEEATAPPASIPSLEVTTP